MSDGQIPTYEALPYTWGPTENPVDLRIDGVDGGSRLAVTQNLAEALQYLGYDDGRSRVLWIDAICVDRQNIPGRGHQVARMADVYSKARVVIVWLGPGRDGSALARGALTDLGSEIDVNWTTKGITPLSGEDYDQWTKEILLFARNQDIVNSIAHLLDRAWFTRFWIWQEIRLARNGAGIRCGYESSHHGTAFVMLFSACTSNLYAKQANSSLTLNRCFPLPTITERPKIGMIFWNKPADVSTPMTGTECFQI